MRSAFTTQALATMGADSEWDRLVANYLRLEALHTADNEFGKHAAAQDKHSAICIRLEHRFGADFPTRPESRCTFEQSYAEQAAAYEAWNRDFLQPYWDAARQLALHPAPTLSAALVKMAVIYRESLWEDGAMARDCMAIVAEDMARLAA
jgi:hypothetical protein